MKCEMPQPDHDRYLVVAVLTVHWSTDMPNPDDWRQLLAATLDCGWIPYALRSSVGPDCWSHQHLTVVHSLSPSIGDTSGSERIVRVRKNLRQRLTRLESSLSRDLQEFTVATTLV